MLTQSEKLWLAERGERPYCNYCANERGSDDCEWDVAMGQCSIRNSHKKLLDALEFSERVAAELAKVYEELDNDLGCHDCPVWRSCQDEQKPCRETILKYARLVVEEKMDADRA